MKGVKELNYKEIAEFSYDSKIQRERHIDFMEAKGWFCTGQIKTLKDNVLITDAKEDDYIWYGEFYRNKAK